MRISKNKDLLDRAKERMEESGEQAVDYAKNPGKLKSLISNAKEKLKQLDDNRHNLKNIIRYVSVFVRMMKDFSSGYYPHLPWKSLLTIIASVLYFINPLDIIPDFIPGIGLIDDITLLGWVYKNIERDVESYLDWEESRA